MGPRADRVSYYNSSVDIHPSARKHGIADEDIKHVTANAMSIDDQEDDTRLYLGPARNADLLEWSRSFVMTDPSLRSTR